MPSRETISPNCSKVCWKKSFHWISSSLYPNILNFLYFIINLERRDFAFLCIVYHLYSGQRSKEQFNMMPIATFQSIATDRESILTIWSRVDLVRTFRGAFWSWNEFSIVVIPQTSLKRDFKRVLTRDASGVEIVQRRWWQPKLCDRFPSVRLYACLPPT